VKQKWQKDMKHISTLECRGFILSASTEKWWGRNEGSAEQ